MIWLVRLYQIIGAPIFLTFGGRCRFYPSCSHYAIEALQSHGPLIGTWLTVKRFVKCGPFHRGGYDPVPPKGTCKHCNKEGC